jgi:hypothetical protein
MKLAIWAQIKSKKEVFEVIQVFLNEVDISVMWEESKNTQHCLMEVGVHL